MHSLNSLQTLRALAAWMVVVHHYMQIVHGFNHASWAGHFFSEVGGFAVEVFFVISGFIMHFSLTQKHSNGLEFFVKRLIRIVPAYWMATLAFVLVVAWLPSAWTPSGAWTWSTLAQSLLFLPHQNPTGLGLYPTLTVGWSLNFEVFFYGLLTGALALLKRGWFLTTVLVLLVLPWVWSPAWTGAAIFGSGLIRLFAFGMLLSSLFVCRSKAQDHEGGWQRRFALLLALTACVACLLGRPLPLLWRVEPLLMQFLACALVWTFVINETWIRRWPGAMRWRQLGDASYSTYLLHTVARFFLLGIIPADSDWSLQAWFFMAYLLLTAALSHLSFRVVETGSAMRWLQSRLLAKIAKD